MTKTLAKHRALKIVSKRLSLYAKALNTNLVEMIKTIRIQNFRSLQDVTLDLQDVNLLIGPNNSGKTNLMKALRFLGEFMMGNLGSLPKDIKSFSRFFYLNNMHNEEESKFPENPPIIITINSSKNIYRLEVYGRGWNGKIRLKQFSGELDDKHSENILNNLDLDKVVGPENPFKFYKLQYQNLPLLNKNFIKHILPAGKVLTDKDFVLVYTGEKPENQYKLLYYINDVYFLDHNSFKIIDEYGKNLLKCLRGLKIYSINISNLKKPYPTLEDDYSVKPDASNLVAFLDNMRDNEPQIMGNINNHLKSCIKEFDSIIFQKVRPNEYPEIAEAYKEKTLKRLGIQDEHGQKYWADELSDGTLYFLALLAIIHQPEPPKLLMIEEPENGIHPRRIKEIIDYFFNIAEEKGIQVILTTHSTVVIDQFKDMPENIFVFDKKDQATQVKNLLTDIIAEDIELSKKNNVPPLDLSGSLGDHWAAGLIGGVPR